MGANDTMTFTPAPEAVARARDERSDKLEASANEILNLAVEANKGTPITARELADYAEVLWLWKTSDTWPKPAGAP